LILLQKDRCKIKPIFGEIFKKYGYFLDSQKSSIQTIIEKISERINQSPPEAKDTIEHVH